MGKFTRDDLQVNDIVTTQAGNMYMVHEFNGKQFFVREQGYLSLHANIAPMWLRLLLSF